ncbi:hypothetical protein D0869_14191 [Hortaea werneckii]|uniref:DHHA2 domain-containing protein n=1 Tax=Hortaea werneckii TaxID=91943 RepID=A0A3M6W2Y2_HORWE|nr:DHH phosphoesterase [Hortaea werneckii]KAI7182547.1 DHH phosphoesterase [Hortaea werneckii]KAI7583939.1 DHH phosphoesterase [Hortaea werneckii]KAI7660753.1 DHH phosphoesterase [Hortaea werneckii]RMX72857.1 hypothetical protein D0869_14191 [Hortaea werneckii]
MVRMSVRTFLVKAKQNLQQTLKNNGEASFVIGNESADLDSITSAIVYGYIQTSTLESMRAQKFYIPVTNIPASDLSLRPELTALLKHAAISPSDLITLDDLESIPLNLSKSSWTLVDHNALQGALGQHYRASVTGCIDHHDDEHHVPSTAEPRLITKSGSCSSLVANHCRDVWDVVASSSSAIGAALGQSSDGLTDDAAFTTTWDAQLAKLGLGSVLIDTVNMTAEHKVTEHDKKAVRYLEARINASPRVGKGYDRDRFFTEINDAKSDVDSLSVRDVLRKDYKQWSEGGIELGVTSVVKPIAWLEKKAEKGVVDESVKFAKSRGLKLFAIMTAFTNESGEFARQLLLIALEGGKVKEAAERFSKQCTEELKLQNDSVQLASRDGVAWIQCWEQKNLAASRKRVAPLLREAMR